jgi:hypothetical protein
MMAPIDDKTLDQAHKQMHDAFVLAGSKVEKKPKEETASEMFLRIRDAKELKKNNKVKSATRTMVKKKKIKKLSAFFPKK